MEPSHSLKQTEKLRFRTESVCVKINKLDALKENVDSEEKNFVVVHEMYQCGKCYKIFNEESALSDHDCIIQKEVDCTAGIDKDMLKFHCKLLKKKYNYDCDQCELSFSQRKLLRKHRKTHKKTSKIKRSQFECGPCGLKFSDKDSLLQHRKSHYIKKWFQCDQCNKRFAYEKLLDWHHRKVHLAPPKLPPRCDICDKIFANSANLRRHRSLHNLPNSKRFTCEICNASFPLKAYLKNHSLRHSEDRPFMCEKCGKTFKTNVKLKQHYVSHEPKIHSARGHPWPQRPSLIKFICDKCGKGFCDKYKLKVHTFIHTGEKPHKCDLCPKAFRYKQLLKNHLFVHDKQFTCNICCKHYATKWTYQKHMKIHNDAEAISCDACDMKFPFKSALDTHYVVHTKEKPYECDLCHRRYSQKSSLNKHPCSQAAAKSTAEILLNLISRNEKSS